MPIIGELFRLQGFINLHSSIRETPDEFWDDDRRCVRLACDRPLMETCARVRRDAHSLTHAPTHTRTHAHPHKQFLLIHGHGRARAPTFNAHGVRAMGNRLRLTVATSSSTAAGGMAALHSLRPELATRHNMLQPWCNMLQHSGPCGGFLQHSATQVRPSGPKLRFLIARDFGVHIRSQRSAAQRSVCAV